MNVLFVDIPRTGATSILSVTGRPPGVQDGLRHLSCRDWCKVLGHGRYAAFTKMSVVRNPIDRFISAYYYLTGERDPSHRFFGRDKQEKAAIGEASLNEVAKFGDRLNRMEHFRPQMIHLIGESGNVEVDCVLRFEQLDDAWKEFAEEFGFSPDLPKTNESPNREERESLTEESKAALLETYAIDFEALDYA